MKQTLFEYLRSPQNAFFAGLALGIATTMFACALALLKPIHAGSENGGAQ